MNIIRRRSFQTKLVLSLFLVIVLTTLLGYFLIHVAINRAFIDFASRNFRSQDEVFQQVFANFYEENGSWSGLGRLLARNRNQMPLVLADESGTVISSPDPRLMGQELSDKELSAGLAIVVDGKTVGTLVRPEVARWRDPLEKRFLTSVTVSLWIAAVIVGVVGIVLSILLFRQLTGPLKRLSIAVGKIAEGKLTSRVEVRSQDELGHLAESFNDMAASLQRGEQAKRQMIADVSHELRTPISVVRTGLEAMRDGLLEASPANIAALHDKIMLTTRLVNDLQQLALADAGQLSIHKEAVDLGEVIERIHTTVGVDLEDRGIDLRIDIPADLPHVEADRHRVEQVLLNLLANASRYAGSGGTITIAGKASGGMVKMSVCDNGRGLSEQDLLHAFDRFYRSDAARSRESDASGGAGLGLAIAKALIEAHGGTIWAENASDGGACFRFTLPYIEARM